MSATISDRALKVWRGLVVSSLPDIPEDYPRIERPHHKHCPPRLCLICLRPDKVYNILLMKCLNAFHLTKMCILTKFGLVIKLRVVLFRPDTDMFLSGNTMQWINAPAYTWFSLSYLTHSSIWCIKTVGLISIRFTGIIQLHIHPTKYMQIEWVHQVDLCV